MKNDEADNCRPFCFIDYSDKAGCEVIIIKQAVIAVDRPVRQVMPGSLDVDDPVDIAFPNFTYSDRQCFHARSPHPFCAHKAVPTGRDSVCPQVRQSSMQRRGPGGERSIPAAPQFPGGTESLRRRKIPAVDAVMMQTTVR